MTTWCCDCDHVHPEGRKDAPWRWRCMKAPLEPKGFGFVTPAYAPSPPYELCSRVNEHGDCGMFSTRRAAPNPTQKD